MSKKIIISTLILISSVITNFIYSTLPTSASIVKNGVEYWSTSEMLELKKQIRAEEKSCSEDTACKLNIRRAYRENFPEQYKALSAVEAELCNIGITAFNPTAETIKVVFNDVEGCLMGEEGAATSKLVELYVVWVEEENSGEFTQINYNGTRSEPRYVTDINNNNLRDGLHLITKQVDTFSGLTWLTPLEEIEISVAGSNLSANSSGKYYYSTFRDSKSTAFGFRTYADCLKSPDYQEGMECRMMFGSNYTFTYLPFSVESNIINTELPTEGITQINKTDQESVKIPVPQSPEISTSTIRVPDTPVVATVVAAPESTPATTSDPISGNHIEVPLAAGEEETHEFPWWFIVFIFSGIFLILWWFIPLPKRKKSKKTLDKTNQIE